VTFAEWDACVREGGCSYRPNDQGWGRGDRPVINVSWDDAQQYIQWLSRKTGHEYRLPSEAEWEYAARAGTATPFHFGRTISPSQANYDGNYTYGSGPKGVYRQQTVAVGSFPANAFGLHDVHGNVWERVEDCYNGSYAGAPTDGSAWTFGDCTRRVLRGGSWINSPGGVRSAYRGRDGSGFRKNKSGYRLAKTLP
jgi:formylglycine-generating enzyme required for sulfatase activity